MAILKIKDKDGNIIPIPAIKGEKGDSANIDVQVNGTSIVQDGVANIPQMANGKFGVAQIWNAYGVDVSNKGELQMVKADTYNIDTRNANFRAIVPTNLDYAVKQAMCDGIGAEWTQEEKASARDRMGIDTWEEVAYVEIEEDVARLDMTFEVPYRKLYVYISQENCETKLIGTKDLYPRLLNDTNITFGLLRCCYTTSTNSNDVYMICENHNNLWIERSGGATNPQRNITTYAYNFKPNDKVFTNAISSHEELNFYGLACTFTNKGTRILVLGVRA